MNENHLIISLLVMTSGAKIMKVGTVFLQKISMNYNYCENVTRPVSPLLQRATVNPISFWTRILCFKYTLGMKIGPSLAEI